MGIQDTGNSGKWEFGENGTMGFRRACVGHPRRDTLFDQVEIWHRFSPHLVLCTI